MTQQPKHDETWTTAIKWVADNERFIQKIAAPYTRHMAADRNDLRQEAVIAAFKAMITTHEKASPERLPVFFRVIFKTNCIKLASGIQTIHCLEDHVLQHAEIESREERPWEVEGPQITEALEKVSARQREICLWLLHQQVPISTPDIAKKFKISRRHACRLISRSIQKIYESSSS